MTGRIIASLFLLQTHRQNRAVGFEINFILTIYALLC